MVRSTGLSPLLSTPARKTSPPEGKSGSIRRQRLLSQLRQDRHDLILIQGSAGAGKSVMAGQWADELGHPVAWVTLDATDNDPVVLISSVINAVQRAGVATRWEDVPLTGDEPTYSRIVLPYFQNCLASLTVPITVVFDDAHEVTDPRAVGLLRCALDCLPAGCHGIIAGRTLTAFPVTSWLAGSTATLVSQDALAMDSREVEEVLGHLSGETPRPAAVSELLQATQGWPIAVYLAAQTGEPTRLGNLTYFSAFLDQDVLRGADEQTFDLLMNTSPLLDLSAPLCDYVLRRDGSAALLERAEGASLLVTRSRDHAWYRLHPLLRDRLQQRLRSENPPLLRSVARRASQWSLARGHTDLAIAYARESDDVALLGTTILAGTTQALTSGQAQRVVEWLAAIDEATIASSCALSLSAAWCAVNRGQPADAHRWSETAVARAYGGWEAHLDRSPMEAGLALLLCTGGSLGYARSAELGGEARRSLPSNDVMIPYSQMVTGWMHLLAGEYERGTDELRLAAHLAQAHGLLGTQVEARALLSTALLAQGQFDTAHALLLQALDIWELGGIRHFLATGATLAGPAAFVAARAGRRDAAAAQLRQVEDAIVMFGPVLPWLVPILEACAAAASAFLGNQRQAGRHLRSAEAANSRLPRSPLLDDLLRIARSTIEDTSLLSDLSPAERRVFDRLVTRETLREIAAVLFVSPETVKTQTGSIYRKLGISSRREVQELGDRLQIRPTQQEPRGS